MGITKDQAEELKKMSGAWEDAAYQRRYLLERYREGRGSYQACVDQVQRHEELGDSLYKFIDSLIEEEPEEVERTSLPSVSITVKPSAQEIAEQAVEAAIQLLDKERKQGNFYVGTMNLIGNYKPEAEEEKFEGVAGVENDCN